MSISERYSAAPLERTEEQLQPSGAPRPSRKSPPAGGTGPLTKGDPGNVNTGGQQPQQPQGTPFAWQDGDREITVLLQDDLTMDEDGKIREKSPEDAQVARGAAQEDKALPVFRSQSGSLMTLPGGVMLALDATWTHTQTDAFFKPNEIASTRVSELGYLVNGFFVETEPGLPSLELANNPAAQPGVEAASPNWRRQVSAK